MATMGSNRVGDTAEVRGHNEVTGTATIQPGTFTEPGHKQERFRGPSRITSDITGTVEKTWTAVERFLGTYPVAACLFCFGLGVAVGRWSEAACQGRR